MKASHFNFYVICCFLGKKKSPLGFFYRERVFSKTTCFRWFFFLPALGGFFSADVNQFVCFFFLFRFLCLCQFGFPCWVKVSPVFWSIPLSRPPSLGGVGISWLTKRPPLTPPSVGRPTLVSRVRFGFFRVYGLWLCFGSDDGYLICLFSMAILGACPCCLRSAHPIYHRFCSRSFFDWSDMPCSGLWLWSGRVSGFLRCTIIFFLCLILECSLWCLTDFGRVTISVCRAWFLPG